MALSRIEKLVRMALIATASVVQSWLAIAVVA
jgi:hypothetical protein